MCIRDLFGVLTRWAFEYYVRCCRCKRLRADIMRLSNEMFEYGMGLGSEINYIGAFQFTFFSFDRILVCNISAVRIKRGDNEFLLLHELLLLLFLFFL